MKLIWQLLRQHVSVLQLAGFLVTNLVGVAIVLTAVQLYRDVTPALQAPDSFLDNDFIILTKEVEGAGIGKTSFTQTELAELAEQPFTEALGEFTPARYSVMGGISLAGIGMRTYLFFESVPDRFLDVRSDEWGFEEGSEFVPIILPRNYLNLYNFGFASTRGLPQVSEDLVREYYPRSGSFGTGAVPKSQGACRGFFQPPEYDPRSGGVHPLVEPSVRR